MTSSFVWLNAERAARLVVGFVQSAMVARHLGPDAFGVLNSSLALMALLTAFAVLGLDNVVARRIALEPAQAGALLGTSFALRVAAGAGLAIMVIGSLFVRSPAGPERTVTAVVALTLVAQSFLSGEAWFAATGDQRPVALARVTAQFTSFGIRIGLVIAGAGVVAFAVVAVLEVLANATLVFAWARRRSAARIAVRVRGVALDLLGESWPVVLSTASVAACNRLDLVLVGHFLPREITGSYAAAVRLNELVQFVAAAVPAATIGGLARLHARNREGFLEVHGALAAIAVLAGATIALAWMLFAHPAVTIVFGARYEDAAPFLRILAWTNVSVFAGSVWSVFWVSERLLRTLMTITVASALATVAADSWLLPRYGATGAAIGTLIGQFLPFILLQFHREAREASNAMFAGIAHPARSVSRIRAWLQLESAEGRTA